MRARAIIERSLQLIRVLASGETADAADMQLALNALNSMIEDWALSPLNILVPQMQGPFTLVNGTAVYTIGPASTFVAPRPESLLDSAFVRYQDVDQPVSMVTLAQYNQIAVKNTPGWPAWMYYEAGISEGTITLFPVPTDGMTLYLASFEAFVQFPDFDTDVPMAPGYLRTLQYNLAAEICDDFMRQLPPRVERTAANTKRTLKRAHVIVPTIDLPIAVLPTWAYGYNGNV